MGKTDELRYMIIAAIISIGVGGVLAFFGFVVGIESAFGQRVMHLPTGLLGSTLMICGVLLLGFTSTQTRSSLYSLLRTSEPGANLSDSKWATLIKYDDELAEFAAKAKGMGPEYERELSEAYAAIGDKAFLPKILATLESKYNDQIREREKAFEEANIDDYIDMIFAVDGIIVAALLKDNRAIGYNEEYKIFESMAEYRHLRKDWNAAYVAVADMALRNAFVDRISHLRNEIVKPT